MKKVLFTLVVLLMIRGLFVIENRALTKDYSKEEKMMYEYYMKHDYDIDKVEVTYVDMYDTYIEYTTYKNNEVESYGLMGMEYLKSELY